MDVYDAIRSRVAVRDFESAPVADAVVKKILLAAPVGAESAQSPAVALRRRP